MALMTSRLYPLRLMIEAAALGAVAVWLMERFA
jgi:hypothetical protein